MEEARQYSVVRSAFLIFLLGSLAACGDVPELSCETLAPIEGITPASSMSYYADDIVERASSLHTMLASDRSISGFEGRIASNFSGTKSYEFVIELRELQRRLALQEARKQATINGGLPPVDPNQKLACEMLAVTAANLDYGQSTDQLLGNLKLIEKRFGPDYPLRDHN